MTYVGAPAIAAALGREPGTIYKWSKAQRRGESIPLNLRRTASGALWCDPEDVDLFFNPSGAGGDDAGSILARMKKHSTSEERRCRHAGHSLKAPNDDNFATSLLPQNSGSGRDFPSLVTAASARK